MMSLLRPPVAARPPAAPPMPMTSEAKAPASCWAVLLRLLTGPEPVLLHSLPALSTLCRVTVQSLPTTLTSPQMA